MPTYAINKQARFDYEILDSVEAGLVLTGQEVKAVRAGHMNLKGSFISFHKNEAFLTNAHITKYRHAGNTKEYDPTASRKLLLHQKEIDRLRGKIEEKGLTIVPISVYTKRSKIKIEIAIVRGKKKHDKRETIKKRDQDRELRRAKKGDY